MREKQKDYILNQLQTSKQATLHLSSETPQYLASKAEELKESQGPGDRAVSG